MLLQLNFDYIWCVAPSTGSARVVSFFSILKLCVWVLGASDGKESACNAGGPGMILGFERSSGGGTGYPLQYSCLENSMDRGSWQAVVHGATESDTAEQLPLSLLFQRLYRRVFNCMCARLIFACLYFY